MLSCVVLCFVFCVALYFSVFCCIIIISYYIISFHAISYHIILCPIVDWFIISYYIILCPIVDWSIISYHIMSYCRLVYHIISYHIMSYCRLVYHIILYHIMSYCRLVYHIILYYFTHAKVYWFFISLFSYYLSHHFSFTSCLLFITFFPFTILINFHLIFWSNIVFHFLANHLF